MVTSIAGRAGSPAHRRRLLSDTDVEELIEGYRAGYTAQSLAERYGVHLSTIRRNYASVACVMGELVCED
jgi:hypothetical protein